MGVFRPRFTMQPTVPVAEIVSVLDRISRRGAHGVCLKAQDVPEIRAAVERLVARNIPVVTLVTDIAGTARVAHAGLDNASANRTAAYLLMAMRPARGGTILVTRSNETFFGEAERLRHFREGLGPGRPAGGGPEPHRRAATPADRATGIGTAPARHAGRYLFHRGGNAVIGEVLRANGVGRVPFIAHDLDRENAALLRDGALDFVLHHDLRADARNVFRPIAAHHGLGPAMPDRLISDVQVMTPFNMPGA